MLMELSAHLLTSQRHAVSMFVLWDLATQNPLSPSQPQAYRSLESWTDLHLVVVRLLIEAATLLRVLC